MVESLPFLGSRILSMAKSSWAPGRWTRSSIWVSRSTISLLWWWMLVTQGDQVWLA